MSITQTIGDLIDNGITVSGMCRKCVRSFEVDLHALAESLGRDHVDDETTFPVKCDSCGGSDVMKIFGRRP